MIIVSSYYLDTKYHNISVTTLPFAAGMHSNKP